MKLFVAIGLLAVAFASQNWETRQEEIREQKFQSGKQYNFKFDGQVASGLPLSSSSQSSASRIESLLSLVFENDRHVNFRINKIRVGSTQKELVESREVQPFGLFEEIELNKEQKEALLLPVRFRYENGLVSEIEFDREEPTWSANIKRAVLNMIQMNLSEKSRTDDIEMSLLDRDYEQTPYSTNNFFSGVEMTLEGDCETSYTVVPTGEKTLRVSKSINFEKCLKRVDIRYNLRFGEECPACDSKYTRSEPNTVSSTVVEFELNGTPKEYLIRETRLRSSYVFTPINGEQQLMSTSVNNKLTLLSIESEVETLRQPKSEKKETIVYSTEWEQRLEKFRQTGEESLLEKTPYLWISHKMDIAEKIIVSLRKHLETVESTEELKSEMVHDFSRLVEVLRVMTIHDLEKLEKIVVSSERIASLYYDALAQAGTYPTISRLVESIVSRRLTPIQTTKTLKMILNVRYPSEKMISELMKLTKESLINESPVYRQSLWLTIGGLMNGVCGENGEKFAREYSEDKEYERCPRELKEKYVREMESLFERANSHYEKVLALKVFANSGIDMIVFPLEKIIKNKSEPKSIRLTAIESLRKLRMVMPRKIQSILLPIYKNIGESVEMRIAAFHHLLHTMPSRVIIDQVVLQLKKEPSTRLYSFVYSTLKAFTTSELPCEKDMIRDIEHSLNLIRPKNIELLDSQSIKKSYYSSEYLLGSSITWAQLFSEESVIPSEISASLDTLFGGEWFSHLAEIGFSQENIDVLISKLYRLVKENEKDLQEVLIRGKRSSEIRPVQLLKDMMKKMGIEGRRSSSKDVSGLVYLRIKDMDYVFLPIEEKHISEAIKLFIKNGPSDLESLEKILSRGYSISGVIGSFVYEKTRVIPTTIGFPLDITWKMPTLVSIDASIKASYDKRTLSLTVSPKMASTHIVSLETRSPLVSHGVKMIHSANFVAPIDLDIKFESNSRHTISINFRLPESESVRLMRLVSRPITYLRVENRKDKCVEAVEKTVYIQSRPHREISRSYGEEIVGFGIVVRGWIHEKMNEKIEGRVSPYLIGENEMEVRLEKTEKSPREYSIRLSVDPIEYKKKMTEDIEMDNFYPTEKTHFNVHHSEKREKSRRSNLNEYLRTLTSSPVISHRLHMTIEAKGSSIERRASGELRTMCDESFSYCKWTVAVSRSPLLEGENREWTLESTLQTVRPALLVSMDEMKEYNHREILALLSSKWGSEEKKTITLRAQIDQSTDLLNWIESQMEKKTLNSVQVATRLNQLRLSVDYNLPKETLTQLTRFSTFIKSLYPLTYELTLRKEQSPLEKEGTLLVKMTVEPQTWRYANVSIETPREMMTLPTIRLPFRPTWFSSEKKESSLIHSFSPICKIQSTRMTTFDEIIYRAPLTTCYSVLAKDCTEEPKFAVLMKKIGKNGEEKKMKIITEENKIEMELKREEIIVTVDGKIVKDNKMEEYGLEKRGDVVIFENEDIFVKFDGFEAEIKMNKMYKSKQCGLCGHFDGEKKGEFRKADDTETEDIEEFHRSFLVKNEECEMEEERIKEKKNYKKFDYDTVSEESMEFEYGMEKKERKYEDEDEETFKPVEKTMVMEYSHRLCFSKVPVPECPKNSHEKEGETKEVKVHFTCVDRSSSEARRYLRESRTEILSLDHLPNSFVESVSFPRFCVAY